MSSIAKRKPKNARSKRAQKEREPKIVESERSALFMRGTHTNELITEILKDLVRASPV
jgi:ribosome production factor 2